MHLLIDYNDWFDVQWDRPLQLSISFRKYKSLLVSLFLSIVSNSFPHEAKVELRKYAKFDFLDGFISEVSNIRISSWAGPITTHIQAHSNSENLKCSWTIFKLMY